MWNAASLRVSNGAPSSFLPLPPPPLSFRFLSVRGAWCCSGRRLSWARWIVAEWYWCADAGSVGTPLSAVYPVAGLRRLGRVRRRRQPRVFRRTTARDTPAAGDRAASLAVPMPLRFDRNRTCRRPQSHAPRYNAIEPAVNSVRLYGRLTFKSLFSEEWINLNIAIRFGVPYCGVFAY